MIPLSNFVIILPVWPGLTHGLHWTRVLAGHNASLTCLAVRGWLPARVPGFSSLGPLVRPIKTGDIREAFQESENQTSKASSGLALKVIQGHSVMYTTWSEHVPSPMQSQGVGKEISAPGGRSGLRRSRDMAHRHCVVSLHSCWSSVTSEHLWLNVCGILVGKYVRLKCKCTVYFPFQYISKCTYVHVTF